MLIKDDMGCGHILHFIGVLEGSRPQDTQEIYWEKDGVKFTAKADERAPLNPPYLKTGLAVISAFGGPRHSTEHPYTSNIQRGTYLTWDDLV